jgi:hypothetical protein
MLGARQRPGVGDAVANAAGKLVPGGSGLLRAHDGEAALGHFRARNLGRDRNLVDHDQRGGLVGHGVRRFIQGGDHGLRWPYVLGLHRVGDLVRLCSAR